MCSTVTTISLLPPPLYSLLPELPAGRCRPDPRNFMGTAAVMEAVGVKGGESRLVVNIDITCLLIGDTTAPQESVWASVDVKQELRQKRLSVSATENAGQRRTIKLCTATAANGELVCLVATIKDYDLPSIRCFPVRCCIGEKGLALLHSPP